MPLVYNDRIIRGPAWCGDCDRPADECRCAALRKEACMDTIYRGREHPLRKTWVKFLRAQHVWFGGF